MITDDPIISKSTERKLVAAIQLANSLASSLASAYWSACEGKKIPDVFLTQPFNYMRDITKLLDGIER